MQWEPLNNNIKQDSNRIRFVFQDVLPGCRVERGLERARLEMGKDRRAGKKAFKIQVRKNDGLNYDMGSGIGEK